MNNLLLAFKIGLMLFISGLTTACASAGGKALPYDAWYLGFFAPYYLEVWIETADVVDVDGKSYIRAMSGSASMQGQDGIRGAPAKWPDNPGLGAGKYIEGANLPKVIYVRWQSLTEPQVYEAYVDISEATRALMLQREKDFCSATGKYEVDYRRALTVGLAPGGIAKVWAMSPCSKAIEVARVKATIVSVGPYQGKSNGKFGALSSGAKTYIDKYGIHKGNW